MSIEQIAALVSAFAAVALVVIEFFDRMRLFVGIVKNKSPV